MLDLLHAKRVELTLDETGKVWINIDESCKIRVGAVDQCVISTPNIKGIENFKGPELAISSDDADLSPTK